MPLSSGLSIHDDTKHKDSAKRGAANGVAPLDASGNVEDVSGNDCETTNNKGAANGYVALDASAKVLQAQMPYEALTVALFQANAATGTATFPANSNDNNTATESEFDSVGWYIEVDFGLRFLVTEFRHYGNSGMSGSGRYKIQHCVSGVWVDNTTDIPVRTTNDWSGWVSLTTPIYTSKIRLVCTTIDGLGASLLREIEMR